jgi:glycosyl transferase, family 25
MKVAYFLINLDDNTERLATAARQLNEQNITFRRISAFDGRQLQPSDHPLYNREKCLHYMGRELVGGEIGCYMSHLKCVEEFLTGDYDYAVVLEDDFKISDALHQKVMATLEWLEHHGETWSLINIGNEKLKISTPLTHIRVNSDTHALHRAHYFPMTTTGLLWNREGAKQFTELATEIFAPVDNYFRFWLTRENTGLAFKPPLVSAIGAQSVIDAPLQNSKRKKQGRTPMYGVAKQRRLWQDKFIALWHKLKPLRY